MLNTQSDNSNFGLFHTQILILANCSVPKFIIIDLMPLCHPSLHSFLYLIFAKSILTSSKTTIKSSIPIL